MALLFLSAVILFGQIEAEVLYSVDGVVYSLVGKELALRPFSEWSVLTWKGGGFYEHPHLTPWLLGLFMKFFGVGTLQAIVPAALISLITVLVTYQLGKLLVGHTFGLVAGVILLIAPQFVKDGRNPMLEPALMLTIMLAILFHLKWMKAPTWRNSLLCGLFVGLALLAKGPPGLLSLGTIAFVSVVFFWKKGYFDFSEKVTTKRALIHSALLLGLPITLLGAVDLWHFSQAGKSFFGHYISHQLQYTVVESRGRLANDWFYYLRILARRNFLLFPFLIAAPILLVIKKRNDLMAPFVVGATVVLGTIAGFSLMKPKANWYVFIYYSGFAPVSAVTLCHWINRERLSRYFNISVLAVVLPVLFLSGSFPSIFTSYQRPREWFLEGAFEHLGNQVAGKPIADCYGFTNPWKGPFSIKFYLDTYKVDCNDASAKYRFVDLRKYSFHTDEKTLFARYPIALTHLERKVD
jgi:4-amino-4-deoxy-L-arabinose transferase-like glycosyltransferase